MSAKLAFPSALILAILCCRATHAQAPPATMNKAEGAGPAATAGTEAAAPADMAASTRQPLPPGLSSWITNGRPDCCGPMGGNGAIKDELYFRTGPSLPVAGPIFGHVLTTGWEVQGGGRTLFFNPEMDRAWTVDLNINSIWNGGQHADRTFPLFLLAQPGPNAAVFRASVLGTLRELNRTSVNLGVGREWYVLGTASSCACGALNWRIGLDGGAAYGSASASVAIDTVPGIPAISTVDNTTTSVIHMLRRRTDTIASTFIGLHSDLEFPCGCCIYQVGLRAEWAFTWSDLLQTQNNSNVMDVNLLMTFGVRF